MRAPAETLRERPAASCSGAPAGLRSGVPPIRYAGPRRVVLGRPFSGPAGSRCGPLNGNCAGRGAGERCGDRNRSPPRACARGVTDVSLPGVTKSHPPPFPAIASMFDRVRITLTGDRSRSNPAPLTCAVAVQPTRAQHASVRSSVPDHRLRRRRPVRVEALHRLDAPGLALRPLLLGPHDDRLVRVVDEAPGRVVRGRPTGSCADVPPDRARAPRRVTVGRPAASCAGAPSADPRGLATGR